MLGKGFVRSIAVLIGLVGGSLWQRSWIDRFAGDRSSTIIPCSATFFTLVNQPSMFGRSH